MDLLFNGFEPPDHSEKFVKRYLKPLLVSVSLVAALMMATPAGAVDGNELYKWGTQWKQGVAAETRDAGSYTGYIQGLIDLHTDLSDREIGIIKNKVFCLPESARLDQAFVAVIRYLEAHPEKHDFTGSSLVASALWEAFPCE